MSRSDVTHVPTDHARLQLFPILCTAVAQHAQKETKIYEPMYMFIACVPT